MQDPKEVNAWFDSEMRKIRRDGRRHWRIFLALVMLAVGAMYLGR